MIWFAVEDVTYSKLNVKYHVTYMICCMAVVTHILVEFVPFKPPYSLMPSKFIALPVPSFSSLLAHLHCFLDCRVGLGARCWPDQDLVLCASATLRSGAAETQPLHCLVQCASK